MRPKKQSFLLFKEQLNAQLKLHNMTIVKASQIAQTSKSVVHGWITGANPHDLSAVARLAEAFNITLYELLFGKVDPCSQAALLKDFRRTEVFSGLCEVTIKKIEVN